MIIFDTETTALIGQGDLSQQPRIIELGILKVDDKTLKERFRYDALVHPGIPLSPEVTKITGLTDKDFEKAKPFVAHYRELVEIFFGERVMVAHNLPFDAGMLEIELTRIQKQFHFPWPPEWKCTVEICQELYHKQIKLQELYPMLTGKEYVQKHRAMDDAMLLYECVKVLRKKGQI